MTSYKKLYKEMEKEYSKLRDNCIDLRKPNLTVIFRKDDWEWEIGDNELIVSRRRDE